jgi:DoxX-like family
MEVVMPIAATKNQPGMIAEPARNSGGSSKGRVWTGRVLSALVVAFMLFDAAGKFFMPGPVVDAFKRLGVPLSVGLSIGLLLLACTIVYAIPRTAVLGAVLLTGYFGGAVAIHLRAGSTLFETLFPIVFGVITWAGIYLREPKLGKVLPVRCLW